ncbi:hypothetical protein ACFP2T_39595 [Plantactinospora solaniradicis]|uniref:HTH cro/C1-type domain-containing protein n=1 Tax=Plantactinospora solaniradicis TaxID=1723736 RepID=A0ABW1KN46_9ACTN
MKLPGKHKLILPAGVNTNVDGRKDHPDGASTDGGDVSSGDSHTLAERLTMLFEKSRNAAGERYSYVSLAEELARRWGVRVSGQYLHSLFTGQRDNPNLQLLRALTAFFGFEKIDDLLGGSVGLEVQGRPEVAAVLEDPGLAETALLFRGISQPSLKTLRAMARIVRQAEGLPDDPGTSA